MFYRLVDKKPVHCATGQEWAEWYEPAAVSGERIVARDELDGIEVSTIFTGIDPNPVDHDPPQLFETMTFVNGKSTGAAIRYATWQQAEAGHRRMVIKARNSDMTDA
jgi:hypothetical protein